MQKEKHTHPIDLALSDARKELLYFVADTKNLLAIIPYGGYYVGKVIGLCNKLTRLKKLLDDYVGLKLWEKNPERKIVDETNFGTLVYIESKTRKERDKLLSKIMSKNRDCCFVHEVSELNKVLCQKADSLNLFAFLNFHVNEIIDILNDLYLSENSTENIRDLSSINVKIPCPEEAGIYEPDFFTDQYSLFESIESSKQLVSYLGLKDTSFTLSEIVELIYKTDNALRSLNERTLRFSESKNGKSAKPTFRDYLQGQTLLNNANKYIEPLQKEICQLRNIFPDYVQKNPYNPQSIGESYTHGFLTDEIDLVCDTCVMVLGMLKEGVQKYAELTKSEVFDESN